MSSQYANGTRDERRDVRSRHPSRGGTNTPTAYANGILADGQALFVPA
jgi:hypothetical protein